MKPDTAIRKSDCWWDLFEKLTILTPKEKGDVFERVVQLYLRTHPEYQTKLQNELDAHNGFIVMVESRA